MTFCSLQLHFRYGINTQKVIEKTHHKALDYLEEESVVFSSGKRPLKGKNILYRWFCKRFLMAGSKDASCRFRKKQSRRRHIFDENAIAYYLATETRKYPRNHKFFMLT
jgi:hypothetical protein